MFQLDPTKRSLIDPVFGMLALSTLRFLQEWVEWFLPHLPCSPQIPGRQLAISLYRDPSQVI